MIITKRLIFKAKSTCPFCLKEFRHLEDYSPPSCGAFKCQKELAADIAKKDRDFILGDPTAKVNYKIVGITDSEKK